MKNILLLILLAFSGQLLAQSSDPNLGIIPAPVSVKKLAGEFRITPETMVLTDSPNHLATQFFANYLKKKGLGGSITDINTIAKANRSMKNAVYLTFDFKGDLPAEGYEISVTGEHITLKGRDAGMFYAVQTLIQIIEVNNPGYATVPCAEIKDYPRFAYRGMHLDVARHFFGVDFVKRYLDLMAAYKLNNFHWHLTDDQGWRVEIKKYPKLTEIGSKRAQTKVGNFKGNDSDLFDGTPYDGFYTQDQILDIVNYAHDRYINIVPEIDMPGHSVAALAAYPELSCVPSATYEVMQTWGVSDNVLCPSETTFKMEDDILREIMELFPGKYIHIGGDECPKKAWKASDFCRNMIADSGLRDENGLQSYFIGRLEKFINSQGRSIIGWDEILEGGLAPNATVMSWRGEKGGIAAAQLGHDVIMTPGSGGMYFDHGQSKSTQEPLNIGGFAPLSKTYAYDPIPDALNSEQAKHVIGVQANLWTEYIPTPAKAEYMLLPRMLALSEVAWSPKSAKDYKNFLEERIPKNLAMLESEGYNFRVPEPEGAKDTTVTGPQFKVELKPLVAGAKIYYTIDGYMPGATSLPYTQPLLFNIPAGKYMEFKCMEITPGGKSSIATDIRMDNTGK
jgi:hexosaminidase